MDISSSLIAKGTAGALAATAAVGTGVAAKEGLFDSFLKINSESVEVKEDREPESNLIVENGKQPTQLSEDSRSLGDSVTDGSEGPTKTLESGQEQQAGDGVSGNQGSEGGRSNLSANSQAHTPEEKMELTKFDQGLINFLETGGDIIFDVKKGNGTEDFTVADLELNDSSSFPITAKVSVSVNESNKTKLIEKTDNTEENGKIITLQKLNGTNDSGTPWTWTCEITFASDVTPLSGKSINDKDRIFKSPDKGLFGILKKDFSGKNKDNAKEKGKKTKEKFIRACAKEREAGKNKTIENGGILSGDQNNLKSEITINLKAGSSDQKNKAEDKLYPSSETDKNMFKELFDKVMDQTAST